MKRSAAAMGKQADPYSRGIADPKWGPRPGERGYFIVVEGLDRSGKTTQVQRLAARLSHLGQRIRVVGFPDRNTPIGRLINSYLQSTTHHEDHVIHLLFAANRWELAKHIEADINSGVTIICDRYYYSGMIYSLAKSNPELGPTWARGPEIGLPRPDLVLFLDVSPEVAKLRGGFGDERYEIPEMQVKVRQWFLALQTLGGEEEADFITISADGNMDQVEAAMWSVVSTMKENGRGDEELKKVGRSIDEDEEVYQAFAQPTAELLDLVKIQNSVDF